jgi:hypothetical protein
MSFRKRLLFFLLIVLALGGLDALCAPFVIAHGVRFWIGWAAKKHHLVAEVGEVEAPFLREVTIRNLRVTSAKGAATEVAFNAATLIVDLNIRGWVFSKRAHLLRSFDLGRGAGSIHVSPRAASAPRLDWRLLAQLLPDNVRCHHFDLDVTTATTAFHFRDVVLNASAIESGKFLAREMSVKTPFLRQTFANLRGATSWEAGRLTIAGIPLVAGLDLEALTIDLSHLARRRLGVDLHLDTYGGTLRASFEGRAGEKFGVDVAGSASNISLAQFSRAVGFLEPVTGSVRASKFTFRGNPGEFLDATASIWMEATDFVWRARRADNVMLGATYYDRRLEVDQLYVRQRQNELTVNGELLWPKEPGAWTRPPFRGQLNASIPDLNGFAQFFGATTGDLSGALFAEGDLDALASEAHGKLALHGEAVKYRGVALDSLGGSFQLKGTEATVESLEARHAQDFVRAQGSFDLAANHRFAGRLTGAIDDLGAYAALLPAAWRSSKIGGGVTFDWSGDGTIGAHSGTMQLFAHGLQLPVAPLRLPLDVTLEGTYSPQDIFFRTFKLASDRVSLSAFLLLGKSFMELQALELSLDGVPRISGTLFLPFSFAQWRSSRSLVAAFAEEQKFDVDLAVDRLDLAQLASALGERTTMTGVLDARLAAFGPLRSLQLTTSGQIENLGPARAKNAIQFQGQYADGRADLDVKASFGVSGPVTLRAWLPLVAEKGSLAAGTVLDPTEQFLLKLDCPALFLETLPNEWRWGADRGLVSGNITFSNTLQAPAIGGAMQVLDARFTPPPLWPELNQMEALIRFEDTKALVDSLEFQINSKPVNLQGRLTATTSNFTLTLAPVESAIALFDPPLSGTNLSTVRMLGEGTGGNGPRLQKLLVRGGIGSGPVSLTIFSQDEQAMPSQATFFLSSHAPSANPLLLTLVLPEHSPALQLRVAKAEPAFR